MDDSATILARMGPQTGPAGGAQSVDRALALLPLIGRSPETGIGLSEIVASTGLSRPTARRLLLALMRARLIEQDSASRRYMLGEEAYVLGILAARRFSLLDVAQDAVQRLADGSGDTAFLSVRRDAFAVCLQKAEGDFPIRVQALQVGFRHPLGIGGGSLAMLAALPEEEAARMRALNRDLIAERYPAATPATLDRLLAETRTRGWALNPGLVLKNSWAVGVALHMPDGTVAGALSIAAIDDRMTPLHCERLAGLLLAEVPGIEARLREMFARSAVLPGGGLTPETTNGRER
ncbi:IclR family transcriptional regulator [Jannaschia rubra]|uniref:Glycerol operon regulatory protein n=1 Tax=Jannaschia rubra TaxID=282197 RepID=A0A0M6XVX9_9RHOB|nr:IclR family transcriptional regulator [Jannaschia rubra]CTQ34717.1 Glycerol operon regulatory protein [Jannaschia rubra]SFG69505.1 transcriptional regulator, IclR family [Jannaschia rubra]